MPSPATVRERRLRKTKAQLIDEIETLEQGAAALEASKRSGAPTRAKAGDRDLADQGLVDLARIPSENPNPVLRVLPDGTVLYANDAAIAVKGLLEGRKKPRLARGLAEDCTEAVRSAEVQEAEFESGDRVFAFSISPVRGESYINIYGRDITEGKRAEEELARKEAQLRVALDNMPGGMMLGDRDQNYVLFNSQYSELHEFPDGLIKIGGSFRDELRYQAERGDFGPGDMDDLIEQVVAINRSGEAESYERVIAGSERTIQVYVAPTPEGGYVTIVSDITERKRAEEELARKEALLRLALDNMPGGLAVNDSDFNYVVVNDWIRDYLGVPDGIMEAGRPMEGLFRYLANQGAYGPGDVDDLVKERFELLKNPEITVSEIVMPDGRILQLQRQPLEDGGNAGIFADITEIKRAQKALSDQLKFTEALVDTIPNPIFIKSANNRYLNFNKAYEEVYGVRRGEYIGKTVMEADFLPLEFRERFMQEDTELLRAGGTRYYESVRTYDDGKEHEVLYWQTRFELAEGEVGGLVGVLVDISEQKALEREVVSAKEAAEAATKAKSQFLANMSHELRTPMNAIIGFSRLVMRRAKDDLEPKQYANLEKILASAHHLLALINDILDLSKIEAGQITIRPAEFALEAVIGDCLRTVEPLIKSDRVRLVQEIESELPKIFTDEDKVRQIVLNLLSNALKFTEEGRVRVRVLREDEMLVIEVADTGIGIPAEAQELIFEEFGQTEDGATRQHSGTGLGLAITRHLAQFLGGDITVESTPGAGSTFTVTILQRYAAGNV